MVDLVNFGEYKEYMKKSNIKLWHDFYVSFQFKSVRWQIELYIYHTLEDSAN